ncbi:MAG: LytTR family DNA-binding domain-containing protein [Parvularculaceae bacterium]
MRQAVEKFVSERKIYAEAAAWIILFSITVFLNIFTVKADAVKAGVEIASWKPFVWEMTSTIALLMLVPVLYEVLRRFPFDSRRWMKWVGIQLAFSVLFSFAHVALMGVMRKAAYAFTNDSYDLSRLLFQEFLYEYRKDVFSYFVLLAFAAFMRRAFAPGMAHKENEMLAPAKVLLTTDKGDTLFATSEIEVLEAAGNYVIVTTPSGVCESRTSLINLLNRLNGDVVRVHRSFAVGRNHVRAIRTNRSGDGEIALSSGKTVRFSRRYRAQLLAAVEPIQSGSANATT